MKSLLRIFFVACMALLPIMGNAQVSLAPNIAQPNPDRMMADCTYPFYITGTGTANLDNRPAFNNNTLLGGCNSWAIQYTGTNVTALSISVLGAPDAAGVAGTFTAWTNQVGQGFAQGSFPMTTVGGTVTMFFGYASWMQLSVATFTGASANVTGILYGYHTDPAISRSSGAIASENLSQIGGMNVVADPCGALSKSTFNMNFASTTAQQLVANVANKTIYICSMHVQAGASTEIISIWDGTQTTNPCDTSTTALDGSTTAANGISIAASGGWTLGNGAGTVYKGAAANHQVCAVTNGNARVTVSGTFVTN